MYQGSAYKIFVLFCLYDELFIYLLSALSIFRGLNLKRYIIDDRIDGPVTYDLIGVSNHYGGLGGGHCKFQEMIFSPFDLVHGSEFLEFFCKYL